MSNLRSIGYREFIALIVAFLFTSSVVSAQKITLWSWHSENIINQFTTIAEWFEADNPGIEVEVVSISGNQREFIEKLYLAVASGAAPDVTWLEGGAVKQLAAQGLLDDVDRIIEGLQFTPGELQEMLFDGKTYSAPWYATSRGFFKRADVLEEAGINPHDNPDSTDELWIWNQKLTEPTGDGSYRRVGFTPWNGNWYARGWIWTFGGELVEETGGTIRPTATLPKNVEAFEWINEWAEFFGRNRSPVSGGLNFLRGTLAMTPESTSTAANYIREGVNFTVGTVPYPDTGRLITWGGGHGVGIPSSAQNKTDAAKLVRYFVDVDVQIRRWEAFETLLPATWDALMTIANELEPEYFALIDQLSHSLPRTPLSGEYHDQLTAAQNEVIAGRKTASAALDAVQTVMSARFAEVFGP